MGNSKNKEKKKLKKLKRAQQQEAQVSLGERSNVLHMPHAQSNVGAMLAQLQTVKRPHEVQAPVVSAQTPQVQVSGELPHDEEREDDEEESWADDEEANDGGGLPVISESVAPVSAPLVQEVAPEIAPAPHSIKVLVDAPETSAPTSEAEYARAVESVTMIGTETRTIETQPEANQEKNMNVVNHPDQVANAAPAPITQPDSSIVAEGAMERMQQDAEFAPQAANAPVVEPVEKKKPQAAFHNIQFTSMFTLDLTNFDFMTGQKNALSRVRLGDTELNLYSPFRRGGKKTDPKPAAEGVVRSMLSRMLDITDAVNNSRVMVVGGADEIQSHINSAIDITKQNIVNLFPTDEKHVVASYVDQEADSTIQLQFGDIVNVRSWMNSSSATSEENDTPFEIHNAVINTTVNAGMLYDAEDRAKEIHRIVKTLETMVEKRGEEANTTIILAIALDASMLADSSIRELVDTFLTDEQFAIYSRQELLRLEENDFLPQTREEVENALFVPKADILLMRIVTDVEEEELEEDGEGGDAPAAEEAAE